MGGVVGGAGDKREPQDSFLWAATLLDTLDDHENERISFPALFCSNLNNESGILSAADRPQRSYCSQWVTWRLQNTLLKTGPLTETRWLRLRKSKRRGGNALHMEIKRKIARLAVIYKIRLLKTFQTCCENVTWADVSQFTHRRRFPHSKHRNPEPLSCWNQPAQPVM